MQRLVKRLNEVYRSEPALALLDDRPEGFEWVDFHDAENTVWSFLRKAPAGAGNDLLVIVNATPVVRHGYRIGVPTIGSYEVILNSDAEEFGGSECVSNAHIESCGLEAHGRTHSIEVDLPPLSVLILKVP
jgi:1,4-alpha-glucan branching enzyme